jgi:hypothetical protein
MRVMGRARSPVHSCGRSYTKLEVTTSFGARPLTHAPFLLDELHPSMKLPTLPQRLQTSLSQYKLLSMHLCAGHCWCGAVLPGAIARDGRCCAILAG